MTFILPSIIEVLVNKIALWINIRASNWTAKSAKFSLIQMENLLHKLIWTWNGSWC